MGSICAVASLPTALRRWTAWSPLAPDIDIIVCIRRRRFWDILCFSNDSRSYRPLSGRNIAPVDDSSANACAWTWEWLSGSGCYLCFLDSSQNQKAIPKSKRTR